MIELAIFDPGPPAPARLYRVGCLLITKNVLTTQKPLKVFVYGA